MRGQTLNSRGARGFTLVEATLALLIAALVLTMVYGSVKGISGSVESISVRNDLYRTNYALLEEMERELSAAFLSSERARNPGVHRTYFHVENEEESGMQKAALYFTTFGHAFSPNPVGESDQSEVCYKAVYDRGKEELVLLKREDLTTNAATCKEDDTAFSMENPIGQRPYVVATGFHPEKGQGYRFTGFHVVLIDQGQQSRGHESRGGRAQGGTKRSDSEEKRGSDTTDQKTLETWDTEDDITQTNRLPRQVKVTLTYEGPLKDTIAFSRTVWLQLSGSVAQTAAAAEQAGAASSPLPVTTTTTMPAERR